jgi:formyltetrahydrofolate-dependent phosphoribosylglycinamide formyltransferase
MTARLAVLISGNGSNLQAILDSIRMRVLDAQVVVVVSNRKAAYGLERAAKAGVPTHYHSLKPYRDADRTRAEYDRDLAQIVKKYTPDYVILAGWMHIFTNSFLEQFPYRVVNLHPALPGKFPGAHAIEEAFAAFQRGEIKGTGVMVHLVPDEQVDRGPVLLTNDVPILPTDTLETLETRIQQTEHRTLVQAIARLIQGDEEE